MKIFENYNSAKQKYGENLVRELTDKGVPSQYLLAACRFVHKGFSIGNIKKYIRQWMSYVKPNDNGQHDINNMSFEDFYETIQKYKRAYGIPNKIYDDGTVSIGKINSPKDMAKFPVENHWCISQPGRFNQYKRDGYTFYLIDNGDESDYVRYAILMVGKDGIKYYYDLDNEQMTSNSVSEFQSHLTQEAISFIKTLNENNDIKTEHNMRKNRTMRLTESRLRGIIHEAVKGVLRENVLVMPVAYEVLEYSGLYDVIDRLKNMEGSDAYSVYAYSLAKALEQFVNDWKYGEEAENIDKKYSRDDLIGMRRNRVKSHYPEKTDDEIDSINQNHFFSPLARKKRN